MRQYFSPVVVLLAVAGIVELPALAQGQTATGRTAPRSTQTPAVRQPAAAPKTMRDPAVKRASGQEPLPGNAQPAANAAPGAQGAGQPAQRRPAGVKPQPAGPVANVPARPAPPKAPFVLNQAQQALLDQVLLKWEKQSQKVKTFSTTFTRYEYDKTFGNPVKEYEKSYGNGEIRYRAPDSGTYIISGLQEFDPDKKVYKPVPDDGLDHWVCDGKAIYEYNNAKKQLIERRLPPEMQGKAIADGPLPFIFGAKADQLKRRYWMRDVTPPKEAGKSIWLEAIPKFQADAANFSSATIILNDSDCMPQALRIMLPGGKNNTDYVFESGKVNSSLAVLDILAPKLSPAMMLKGWKHVVEEAPKEPEPEAPPAVSPPIQARRAAPGAERK